MGNEETLKKLQDRLSFQQLHLNIFLQVLTRKASELKNRIALKSKHLADKMLELNAVNQSIEKKGSRLKQLEETVERMKSRQVGGGGRALEQRQLSQQGGDRGALEPRQKVHLPQWDGRGGAVPQLLF